MIIGIQVIEFLDYREKRYKIIKRKNAPDDWEIIEEKKNYYSFDQNSKIGDTMVKDTLINDNPNFLIDFLLQYLSFIEELGDSSNDIVGMDMIV